MAKQTWSNGFRAFERNNEDVKAADALKVPLSRIKVEAGFNPRDLSKPETQDKIRAIAESYKAGRFVDPIKVRIGDDSEHVIVVDGECRYTAAKIADTELRREGVKDGLPFLTVIPFRGNDIDQLIHAVTANEGERLTPLELAEVVKRFINLNYGRPDVARMLGKSLSWVDQLYFMSGMDKAVKDMVASDRVASDVAMAVAKTMARRLRKNSSRWSRPTLARKSRPST
jgi:ParB family chromosome partitioning protein